MSYKITSKLTAIFALLSFLLISYSVTKAAIGTGDGNILRRSAEETCHSCHKTDQNAPTDNASLKTHSAEYLGTCSNSAYKYKTLCLANGGTWTPTQWSAQGGWGVSGGKYGKFGCTTCHTAHDTTNIYLIREKLSTPDNVSNWPGGTRWTTVDFRVKSGTAGVTVGLKGDDSAARTTSTRICEVCHSVTAYHRYDLTGQSVTNHNNAIDCQTCHTHASGFAKMGGGGGGVCGDCHGYPPNASAMVTDNVSRVSWGITGRGTLFSASPSGMHSNHIADGFSCSNCHNGGMQLADGSDKNHYLNIGFNIGSETKGSYTAPAFSNGYALQAWSSTVVNTSGSARTCSNIYCHSDVQNSTGTAIGSTFATANWDSTFSGRCGTCHNADGVQGNASWITTGSHSKHILNTGTNYNFQCNACHLNLGSGAASHGNFLVEVAMSSTYGGSYSQPANSPANGFGTCSTNYCHSSGEASPAYDTPVWGSSGSGSCGSCHGVDSTSGPSTLHAKHVENANYQHACVKCHSTVVSSTGDASVVPTISDKTKHVNKIKEVAFDSYNPIGTIAGATCSQIYCHSSGKGQYKNATWSGTLSCNKCHGTEDNNTFGWPAYTSGPAGSATANSHARHSDNATANCHLCHSGTTLDDISIKAWSTSHVDKTIQVSYDAGLPSAWYSTGGGKSCSVAECHGPSNIVQWGGAALNCASCHPANKNLQGNHSAHYASLTTVTGRAMTNTSWSTVYEYGCGVCHKATAIMHANNPASAVQAAPVEFDATIAGGGTYTAGAAVAGTDAGLKWTAGAASNACASIYCHSAGDTTTPPYGAPKNTTFQWVSSSKLTCAGCHGYDNASGASMISQAHSDHINLYNRTNISGCNNCHNATTTNGTSITDKSKHVNKTVDVQIKLTAGWGTGTWAGGNCSSVYCHSTGTASPTYFTPEWSSAGSGSCGTCHGATAANPPATGIHAKHAGDTSPYQFKCYKCHTGVVDNNTTAGISSNGYTATHVNNSIDVAIETGIPGGGTYVSSKCSSNYCHSSGRGLGWQTVAWSGSLSCNGCHGAWGTAAWVGNAKGYPSYISGGGGTGTANSHYKHSDASQGNVSCAVCHADTTTDGTTIVATNPSKHVNGSIEITFNGTQPSGWYSTGGGKVCGSVSCHGAGISPQWGAAGSCASCHGFTNTWTTNNWTSLGRGHWQHAVKNSITCDVCHRATVDNANTIIWSSIHGEGLNDISLRQDNSSAASAYNGQPINWTTIYQKSPAAATGTCSTTFCHGSTSGNWGTFNNTIAQCTKCHGVATTTDAQYAAEPNRAAPGWASVGVNTADTVGAITNSVSADSKVGAHNSHLGIVKGYTTLGRVVCNDCHGNVTAPLVGNHMKGSTTFVWSSFAQNLGTSWSSAGGGGLSPSYSGGTCSSVYCHGNAFNAGNRGNGITVGWTSTAYLTNAASNPNSTDCNRCHLSPPAYKKDGVSAHDVVAVSAGACTGCHGHTGSGPGHLNGVLEASGGSCNGCHSYDTTDAGAWTTVKMASAYLWNSVNAWGAHAKHINHLKARYGVTLAASGDTYGGTAFSQVCGTCHSNDSGQHNQAGAYTRNLSWNTTRHSFGGNAYPVWNATTKSCSNLDCHYKPWGTW